MLKYTKNAKKLRNNLEKYHKTLIKQGFLRTLIEVLMGRY